MISLLRVLLASAAFVGVYGCATAPSMDAMKAETAGFQLPKLPDPDRAMVYVVRPSMVGGMIRFNVFVDKQEESSEVGYTRGNQYIYFSLAPGERKIYSKAETWAEIAVSVKAGETVFIRQTPSMGIIMARNALDRIEELEGKYYVKTLNLGELLKQSK
jgi:hypothetical protein